MRRPVHGVAYKVLAAVLFAVGRLIFLGILLPLLVLAGLLWFVRGR